MFLKPSKNGPFVGIHRQTTEQACVESLRAGIRSQLRRGQYYFLLQANHKVIGKSESYTSAASMEKGIKAVIKDAKSPAVHDLTQ